MTIQNEIDTIRRCLRNIEDITNGSIKYSTDSDIEYNNRDYVNTSNYEPDNSKTTS